MDSDHLEHSRSTSFYGHTSNHSNVQVEDRCECDRFESVGSKSYGPINVNDGKVHLGDRIQIRNYTVDQAKQQYDQLLASLRSPEMNLRKNQITANYPKTFGWIFQDHLNRPWHSFTKWLSSGEGLYWVRGKPGSGKSTLMKYMSNHPRTLQLLNRDRSTQNATMLEFYFWIAGVELQRSLIGCLSSLLYQLAQSFPKYVKMSLRECQNLTWANASRKHYIYDWSSQELETLIQTMLDHSDNGFCIFLDGLDEFDKKGDIQELLEYIERLRRTKNVKLCVSSREEPRFKTAFPNTPSLKLQDLNKKDIQTLVSSKLLSSLQALGTPEKKISRAVQTMADKAEGVFLWAVVATNALMRDIESDGSIETFEKRLNQLPTEMSTLFRAMLDRLHEEDRKMHGEETELYFSFAEHLPMSILSFTLATSPGLRARCMSIEATDGTLLLDVSQACKSL